MSLNWPLFRKTILTIFQVILPELCWLTHRLYHKPHIFLLRQAEKNPVLNHAVYCETALNMWITCWYIAQIVVA